MAVDRVNGETDASSEAGLEQHDRVRPPPPDRPGVEGFPSRAESRARAAAANTDAEQASERVAVEAADDQTMDEGQEDDRLISVIDTGASAQSIKSDDGVAVGNNTDIPWSGEFEVSRPLHTESVAAAVKDSKSQGVKAAGSFAERLDVPLGEDQPTPREVLERFAPMRVGLREISKEEAKEYIGQNAEQRPWLSPAKECDPAVQRVIAALDQGGGHALERHEGFAEDDKLFRRVAALEDPAQLDADKRSAGIDGCKPGNQGHRCGTSATAIQDPDAFATAFVRGTEHQKVREVLDTPFIPGNNPPRVSIPLEELLGPEGHRYCNGYALTPVAGELRAAMDCRDAWVDAHAHDRDPDVPPPQATKIDSFSGGTVEFFFKPNPSQGCYEVNTMYVESPENS